MNLQKQTYPSLLSPYKTCSFVHFHARTNFSFLHICKQRGWPLLLKTKSYAWGNHVQIKAQASEESHSAKDDSSPQEAHTPESTKQLGAGTEPTKGVISEHLAASLKTDQNGDLGDQLSDGNGGDDQGKGKGRYTSSDDEGDGDEKRRRRRKQIAQLAAPLVRNMPSSFATAFQQRLQDIQRLFGMAVPLLGAGYESWIFRVGVLLGFILLVVNAVIGWIVLPVINIRLISGWEEAAGQLLGRKVQLSRVLLFHMGGLVGMGPLTAVGPVTIGPGVYEGSYLSAPRVDVYVDLFASLMRRMVVLQLKLMGPHVTVVQGVNFSWCGYPEDTVPSARNFTPGLGSVRTGSDNGNGPSDSNNNSPSGPNSGKEKVNSTGTSSKQLQQQLNQQQQQHERQQQQQLSGKESLSYSPSENQHIVTRGPYRIENTSAQSANQRQRNQPSSYAAQTVDHESNQVDRIPVSKSNFESTASGDQQSRLTKMADSTSANNRSRKSETDEPYSAASRYRRLNAPQEPFLSTFSIPRSGEQRGDMVIGWLRTAVSRVGAWCRQGQRVPEDRQRMDDDEEEGQGPPVALAGVSVRNGLLDLKIHGEPGHRRLEYVNADISLGRNYTSFELAVDAEARRVPASYAKCTLVNPAAKRHLRHVTPGSAHARLRRFGCDSLPKKAELAIDVDGSAALSSEGEVVQVLGKSESVEKRNNNPSTQGDQNRTVLKMSGSKSKPAESIRSVDQGREAGKVLKPESEDASITSPKFDYLETVRVRRGKLDASGVGDREPTVQVLRTYGILPESAGSGPARPMPSGYAADKDPLSLDGGSLSVRITCRGLMGSRVWPDLNVLVRGEALHAPLIERLVELPMDVYAGRVGGDLRIRAFDAVSFDFPEISGRVKCRGLDFHFWDAPDDISAADMDLVFERDRVYLHGASGHFGAIPLKVAGDLDLNPATGSYRLSATVGPAVELNALRASLGVRPVPVPVAGAIRGLMHCTGPLEKPVFSGSAVAVRPPPNMLAASEPSLARSALESAPAAVAAFDHIPLTAAAGVFTMDLSTEMFTLHSATVQPIGGGNIFGRGRMWVSPIAESDPRAINMSGEASDLDGDKLASYYLPKDVSLPPGLSLGRVSSSITMSGSHLAPAISFTGSAPLVDLAGSVQLRPDLMHIKMAAPNLGADLAMSVSVPNAQLARAADTQAEATLYSRPRFEGCNVHMWMHGVDLLPLALPDPPFDPLADSAPLRARASVDLRMRLQHAAQESKLSRPGEPGTPQLLFEGPIMLSNLALNQLHLASSLTGTAAISTAKVAISMKGDPTSSIATTAPALPLSTAAVRPGDAVPMIPVAESLDLVLALPDIVGMLNLGQAVAHPSVGMLNLGQAVAHPSAAAVPTTGPGKSGSAKEVSRTMPTGQSYGNGDGSNGARGSAAARLAVGSAEDTLDSSLRLAHGPLKISADLLNTGSEVHVQVRGLTLDDLEIGSFRGYLSSTSLDADLVTRRGRASVVLERPRCASLTAAGASCALRWEGDVLKLEEAVLRQQESVYELSGELFLPDFLPPGLTTAALGVPKTVTSAPNGAGVAADDGGEDDRGNPEAEAEVEEGALTAEAEMGPGPGGRWRLMVRVPHAYVEELLPAAQLVAAASAPGRDYGTARSMFLSALHGSLGVSAEEHLQRAVDAAVHRTSDNASGSSGGQSAGAGGEGVAGGPLSWRELCGRWGGTLQFIGSPAGATNIEFSLAGDSWTLGSWMLDRLTARGVLDSVDGVMLEDLSLCVGPAQLSARGALLCAEQDAALSITGFPLDLLQPLWGAGGALGAVAAVAAAKGRQAGGLAPLGRLMRKAESSLASLGLRAPSSDPDAIDPLPALLPPGSGPVRGRLYAEGSLRGSVAAPSGYLSVKVEEGALGAVRLDVAEARVDVEGGESVTGSVHFAPADSVGHLRAEGYAALPAALGGRLGRSARKKAAHSPKASILKTAPDGQEIGEAEGLGAELGGEKGAKGLSGVDVGSAGAARREEVDVSISVKDGGMSLVCALLPDVEWQGGGALIDVRVHGALAAPQVKGRVAFSRASLSSSLLRHPVTNLAASIMFDGDTLAAKNVSARIGKSGSLSLSGSLPLHPSSRRLGFPVADMMGDDAPALHLEDPQTDTLNHPGLHLTLSGVDLRARGIYAGQLDIDMEVTRAVTQPILSGWLKLSRGSIFLLPQGGSGSGTQFPSSSQGRDLGSGNEDSDDQTGASSSSSLYTTSTVVDRRIVAQAFALLKAGRRRAMLASTLPAGVGGGGADAGDVLGLPKGSGNDGMGVELNNFEVVLGPELRAVFPLVLNVMLSGKVSFSGPVHPTRLAPSGCIHLDSGSLNLLATAFELDREASNTLTFSPDTGLDPTLDVAMISGELRVSVQGRGSTWQEGLTLSAGGTTIGAGSAGKAGAGAARGGLDIIEPAEVARVFEARLADVLVGQGGSLALRSLAASTLSGLLPRLEAGGELGAARWRVVGSPSLAGLMAAEPGSAFLASLALGTEVELAFGKLIQATLAHRFQDGAIGTSVSVSLSLGRHMRLQAHLSSRGGRPPGILLQYSSDAMPG